MKIDVKPVGWGMYWHCCLSVGIKSTLLVAQLFESLRYKPEGRGFDSRWCPWNFSLT
jgi:hypothetical protein